jgi:hypothetical protein
MNHRITPNRDRVNVNEMMRFLLLMRLVCYVHSTLQEFEQLLHSSEHSIVKIEDSFVSVKHIKRLIKQNMINENNVDQIHNSISFIEEGKHEITKHLLRDQIAWKNPLAGAFHKGAAIPYFNGYACVFALMPGPAGKCIRDKALGKAAFGCTGLPDDDLMKKESKYASKHCSCTQCGSMDSWSKLIAQGDKSGGAIIWTPYCHTRGINHCYCGLVDMSIKDSKTCYDLW